MKNELTEKVVEGRKVLEAKGHKVLSVYEDGGIVRYRDPEFGTEMMHIDVPFLFRRSKEMGPCLMAVVYVPDRSEKQPRKNRMDRDIE